MEDHSDFVSFSIESRILRELGEQLVSDPQVALTELIKNSYDADASFCDIKIFDDKITISDDGHGMTLPEFKAKWMTIATSNKEKQRTSRFCNRKLTGSKGVGRFAVRFLGRHLTIESIAKASDGKNYKLEATFDWATLDAAEDINKLRIPYTLNKTTKKPGTILTIRQQRVPLSDADMQGVKSGVLSIASPVYAFISDTPAELKGLFESASTGKSKTDPGFNINLSTGDGDDNLNLADAVLKNYVCRSVISVVENTLTARVYHSLAEVTGKNIRSTEPNSDDLVYEKRIKISNVIGSNIYIDLRYFPRRSGVFQGKGFNGKAAWTWVRDNNGVGMYDHGFRIRPYGYPDDDWLKLDKDNAHNERDWQSTLMHKHLPMDAEARGAPKLNPMIGLPTNYQTVGAVFVQSGNGKSGEGLSPSMDRQGYVNNKSFKQLQEITRFGVELIAHHDKYLTLELEKQERTRTLSDRKSEIEAVIREINSSSTLTSEDKERIVTQYARIRDDIEKVEEYDRDSREGLAVMSLLGVVAGFMTHEFQAALMILEQAAQDIRDASKVLPKLGKYSEQLEKAVEYFTGYIDYTKLFVNNIQSTGIKQYKSLPSIKHVISTFGRFQDERKIKVITEDVDRTLTAPLIPAAMYQGIIHNLYTNALKALLNHNSNNKIIKIQAWNEGGKKHIIQIMDNGPGIPSEVKNRIWDPLYTTSSTDNNPLGSGMGLGLPLVKKVVESKKGTIKLVTSPAGFSTCFRVELPLG